MRAMRAGADVRELHLFPVERGERVQRGRHEDVSVF